MPEKRQKPAVITEFETLIRELHRLVEQMPEVSPEGLSAQKLRRFRATITDATKKLNRLRYELDPVKQPKALFDPSNPSIVGRFVALALLAQPRRPLAAVGRFYGSGVYALYYNGDFESYLPIANTEHPIYVGKADPADPAAKTPADQGDKLAKRLDDHRKSITKAQEHPTGTLRLADFECRFLVVQSGWQTAAEDYLIDLYKPVWNNETSICYGFGKHGDAAETRTNQRSPWDTLHPGRPWADNSLLQDAKTPNLICCEIAEHLTLNPPLTTIEAVFERFIEEMQQT